MSKEPISTTPPETSQSLPETTSRTPSVADYLEGISLPLPPLRAALRPSTTKITITSDRFLVNTLLNLIVERSGMSQAEISRQMGIQPQSLNQYLINRRSNPSITWVARLAELAGARLIVEWPTEASRKGGPLVDILQANQKS